MRAFIEKYYSYIVVGIALFALCTRLYRIERPQVYIFDEVYHALTAKLMARGDVRAFEWWNPPVEPNTAVDWLHPPYAKYTQALSMKIFGENSVGWRFSSVVFGVLVIVATALLADELFGDKRIAVLAALLASFDGLLLVQSRIAMNDIHVTFFILLTLICYVRYRKLKADPPATKAKPLVLKKHHQQTVTWLLFTGIAAGIAMGTKWSGVFALGIIWFFEITDGFLKQWRFILEKKSGLRPYLFHNIFARFLCLLIIPVFVYLLSYSQMFLQGKSLICEGDQVAQGSCYCSQESSWWVNGLKKVSPQNSEYWESLEARGGCKKLISHFSELNHQIWWYQTNLKATHTFQSRPLQWFLNLRPVWMHVEYQGTKIGNIYAQGNPVLFWTGAVFVLFSIWWLLLQVSERGQKKSWPKHFSEFSHAPLTFLLFSYFAVWLPWQISPRIMFFYHYTPAVPLLCIILGFWLIQLADTEAINRVLKSKHATAVVVGTIVAAIFITFILFYPNWTGILVPKTFADKVYFALPTWK